MPYRHTQIGYVTLGAFAFCVAAIAWAAAPDGYTAGELLVLALVAGVGLFFSSLTVEIALDRMRVWFGPGWIRRTVPLREIESAAAVRVPWYVGWGMRWWGYWLYNVSGHRAVVLRLRGGRRFGIGTDEPEVLLVALRGAGVTGEGRR
ncbi:MAG: hypothetical protein A2V59_01370 [Armatimonadetes bacterium RBG_19FT_COMBO_69_19]|nr:MAG: hypothetical protein A2V59_01370 [Armatimonadetes bacterium RBG_19FT_COMBO_69_19]